METRLTCDQCGQGSCEQMKLYVTPTSPYARMARIVVLEKGLTDSVEIIAAQTRQVDSPYYDINPSGRVPYLVLSNGVGLEDSALICSYLDHLDSTPVITRPAMYENWDLARLEMLTRSMLDGLSVRGRELTRPTSEQSPTILQHEAARAERMADFWNVEIDDPLMREPFNMAQLTLIVTLTLAESSGNLLWREGRENLAAWVDQLATRPFIAATAPGKPI